MNKNFFINLHNASIAKGMRLPAGAGLCMEVIFVDSDIEDIFSLFEPSFSERIELNLNAYWAAGDDIDYYDGVHGAYTPLRQTIVLFCHEILNS